jgi:hypothetical protein
MKVFFNIYGKQQTLSDEFKLSWSHYFCHSPLAFRPQNRVSGLRVRDVEGAEGGAKWSAAE